MREPLLKKVKSMVVLSADAVFQVFISHYELDLLEGYTQMLKFFRSRRQISD